MHKKPKNTALCKIHGNITNGYQEGRYLRCKLCSYDKVVRYRKNNKKKLADMEKSIKNGAANDPKIIKEKPVENAQPVKRFYKPCFLGRFEEGVDIGFNIAWSKYE